MGLSSSWSRRRWLLCAGATVSVAACGRKPAAPADKAGTGADADAARPDAGGPPGSIAWAVAGRWRDGDVRRDRWRHPRETLEFFGLKPGMAVVEMWPGAGWYTQILAPFLKQTGGKLYAASFEAGPGESAAAAEVVQTYRKMFGTRPGLYGDIVFEAFGPMSGPVAPPASADMVLFMLTLHSWMAAGLAEKAFDDAYAALKPGGVLGVEAHRADMGQPQDPLATNGYIQEAYAKRLAMEAGFRFDAASNVNANPKDTRDHPFGVWTLPPERRSAPVGEPADPAFDHAPYDAIGESDRMTLRFVKPR
jgi:predicted methyltransferase